MDPCPIPSGSAPDKLEYELGILVDIIILLLYCPYAKILLSNEYARCILFTKINMLFICSLDAVLVISATSTHTEYICESLNNGKYASILKRKNLQQHLIHYFHEYILSEKSLAIYFGDSQFRRNRTFNLKVSKIYVDKRSRVR